MDLKDLVLYPLDASWMLGAGLLLVAVCLVVFGAVRAVLWRARRAQRDDRERARRSAARARFERHEASKARVRFVPTNDTTDTR